jgi:hypothetical protein
VGLRGLKPRPLPGARDLLRAPGDEVRKFVGPIVGDGVLLRSDDEGATWGSMALAPALTGSFRAVEAGGTRIVAVGDGGLAIVSTDTGLTRKKLDTGTTADLRRLWSTSIGCSRSPAPARWWRPGGESAPRLPGRTHGRDVTSDSAGPAALA